MYGEGEWGETGWSVEAGASWNFGSGIKSSQLNNDKIITVVGGGLGGSGIHDEARRSGIPHTFAFTGNYSPGSKKYLTEVPFRVKVYKLAKIN